MPTDPTKLKRPPVVVVMGHVDHGKTTLLDYIRKSNVAAKEAGGITQGIGAYEISHNGQKITFIDTPGHEAFAAMRSRGAAVADIAILVVAADDSVKPQTKEAIKIIQESKIPYVVAINKIDKNNADPDKVKKDLLQSNVLLEGMGGTVSFQLISAKDGQGMNELLDLLLLTADVEGLDYDPAGALEGVILEAKRESASGITVTAIITNGTLSIGDEIHAGAARAKVKDLKDFLNKKVTAVTASSPVLVLGFESLPKVGDALASGSPTQGPAIAAKKIAAAKDEKRVNIIIKANNAGSLEALTDAIKKLMPPEKQTLHILDSGVGEVTDGDTKLAISTSAYVIAFKVKLSPAARNMAKTHALKIFESEIIYELLGSLEKEFKGESKKVITGDLEILAVFSVKGGSASGGDKTKQVVGGKIIAGTIKNQSTIDIERKGAIIATGKIVNLQQMKKDIQEVSAGECGLLINATSPIAVGDHLISHGGQ